MTTEPPTGKRPPPRKARPGRKLTLQAAAEQLRVTRAPAPQLLTPRQYVPPVTELSRLVTSRLLPARYSDSVLTRIADSEDDLQLIYALDNATNERLLAEGNNRPGIAARELVYELPFARIINAAFSHPHPQGARFSSPNRGAWYAGFDLQTAKAEVLFHRSVQFTEIGWLGREELDYDHYHADFSGPFHDLRPEPELTGDATAELRLSAQRAACLQPASYVASQQLAMHLLELGSLGVVYPSARRAGGICIACFRPGAVANVRKRELHRLTWYPDAAPSFVRVPRDAASAAPGPKAVRRRGDG